MSTKQSMSSWPHRWQQLLMHLRIVSTEADEQKLLSEVSEPIQPITLAFVNAHAMNLLVEKPEFYDALMVADIVLRDGIGMQKLLDSQQREAGLNMNGTDFIPQVIGQFANKSIVFMGTQEPYLAQAKSVYMARGDAFQRIQTLDGFQPIEHYVEWCLRERPDLVVLGMGMPKQELLAQQLKAQLQHPCLIVCGGAILDFLGGKVDRAPKWIRQANMEWVYRFLKEPKRLFKRYVIGNPLFLYRARKLKKMY